MVSLRYCIVVAMQRRKPSATARPTHVRRVDADVENEAVARGLRPLAAPPIVQVRADRRRDLDFAVAALWARAASLNALSGRSIRCRQRNPAASESGRHRRVDADFPRRLRTFATVRFAR